MDTMRLPTAAGPLIDLLEDVLHLDQPLRHSVRRRVDAANGEAVRMLRRLAAEDEQLLAPANARSICNAIARRHGVKPRFMLPMRALGEQLALEFAQALLPTDDRRELIDRAVHLEQRRSSADPQRRRDGDHRADPRVEWIALAQAVLAVGALVSAAVLYASGRAGLGLGFAIGALSLVVFARAALALSTDRQAHVLVDPAALGRAVDHGLHAAPRSRPVDIDIDLRATD